MAVTIDPADALDAWEDDEAVIVDVREADERSEVKIPGSLHVPWEEFEHRMDEIPDDETVVFHCRKGGRAQRARKVFAEMTDAEALDLRGGIVAWDARGFPTEQG